MLLKFTKMHGCGNDYIYFDCTQRDFPGGAQGEKEAAIKLSGADKVCGNSSVVERHLAKVNVASSNLVFRSKGIHKDAFFVF